MLEQLLNKPRLVVLEEPKERGMRFRYECEGRSAGSILGASSSETSKSQPTIEVDAVHFFLFFFTLKGIYYLSVTVGESFLTTVNWCTLNTPPLPPTTTRLADVALWKDVRC